MFALTGRFRSLFARQAEPYSEYGKVSFSQQGEDMLLARIFKGGAGFYVDVGAHHPLRFSNTHIFYLRGWRGINIDATPGSMAEFQRLRPRDINVEALVSDDDTPAPFFMFNEPALNTMSASLAAQRPKARDLYKVTGTVTITPRPLHRILDEFLPEGQPIDFYNIDVEGLDMNVLKSNDWQRYRPLCILVELEPQVSLDGLRDHEITQYLRDQGYSAESKLGNTVVFKRLDDAGVKP